MRGAGALLATTAMIVVASGTVSAPASAAPTPLNGLFGIDGGVCSGNSVTGSFFRMILPAGSTSGPFLSNSDSGCGDKTVTPLSAGSDGGLTSGSLQPQPAQAFDGSGNALSGSVTRPVKFYGVGFATATNGTDPQTGQGTADPQLRADGTALTGNLSAFGVTWNKQVFNQGAPKPGGALPGKTSAVRGTIDRSTGAYFIEWTSQIVGGPFNNFTGLWHLAGTYKGSGLSGTPAAGAPAAAAPAAPAASPGAPAPSAAPAPGRPPAAAAQPAPAQAQTVSASGDPALTAQAIRVEDPDGQTRWLLPLLVAVTAIATAVLTNADRLVRRRRGE